MLYLIELKHGRCSQLRGFPLSVLPQLFLEEESFSLREAQRTVGQAVRLYLLRFVLNLLVLSLLAGAFYLIYYAAKTSQKKVRPSCWFCHSVSWPSPASWTYVPI